MATNESVLTHRKVTLGSERNFGIVFATVFAIVALLPLLHWGSPRLWAFAIAAAFAAAAFLFPQMLRPLNQLWFKFGLALHHVVNPLIMGLIYYGAVVPTGLILQISGKDLLRLKWEPAASTYWIPRKPASPAPGSMSKQY